MSAPSITGDLSIADKIVHTGDTNTAIRFPAADTVSVETAGSERLTVQSDGDIGLAATSPNASGFAGPTVSIGKSANPYSVLELQGSNTSDGAFAILVGYNSGGSARTAQINFERKSANNSGSITFETASSGSLGTRVRISNDGLLFGSDTAAANALDDYEEGTYTPADASGQSITFSNAEGLYTKVGRLVHVQGSVTFPSTGGQFGFAISLPFTATASGRTAGGGDIRYTTHTTAFNLHVNASTTHFSGYNFGGTLQKNADLSTDRLDFQLTYAVA